MDFTRTSHGGSLLRVLLLFLSLPPAVGSLFAKDLPDPQANEYSRRIWRTQDGLPESRIQALAQTPDGYLWIGTGGGLVRFDGIQFTVFDRSNTPAFRDDNIQVLRSAKDGSLWIGSGIGTLLHYINGSFRVFDQAAGLPNGFVHAIYEDRRGTLWVGTDSGLFRLDGSRLVRQRGETDSSLILEHSITEDSDGRLWVGGSTGLFFKDGDIFRRYSLGSTQSSNRVLTLKATSDGLRVATLAGLWRLRGGKEITRASQALPSEINISLLDVDRDGNVWIGTLSQGLIRLRDGALTAFHAPSVLPDNAVLAMLEDRERNLWIGTGDGLLRLSKTRVKTVTAKNGLSDEDVLMIYEDPEGPLWLTARSGQLYRLKGNGVVPFGFDTDLGPLRIRTLLRDKSGALWIGTYGQGVLRLSGGKLQSFGPKSAFNVRSFYEDRRGIVWIATPYGLACWDGRRLRNYSVEEGLAHVSVRVMAEDRNGDLFIGTDGGLSRMHDGKFVRDSVTERLGNTSVLSIHQDAEGAMWLGTRGDGLFRINAGNISQYTTREGLLSNTIYQILEDKDGGLWMSTPSGVFSTQRKEFEAFNEEKSGSIAITVFGTSEGMETSRMNGGTQPAGCRTVAGQLWFPSVKGAVLIDPKQIPTRSPVPVLVETMLADDRPVPVADHIHIRPGRGKLEIHYTAFNLRSPEQVTFRYMLEGFDSTWSIATTQRRANYTNLPPGNYRFRVIASNGPGLQNTSQASLSFLWTAHWYQTAWFYAVCVFFLGLLGSSVVHLNLRKTKNRYRLLLAERTRVARELHDTLIQGCIGVSTLLEAAAASGHQSNHGWMTDLLDRARIQMRLTLDEARQAVWDLRRESTNLDIEDSLGELRQLGLERGIQVQTETKGARTPLDPKVSRDLVLVAKEALRNACVHGNPRQVAIRLLFEPRKVCIEIIDDGCGFDPTNQTTIQAGHFGVAGMRERVEQLGGSLQVASGPGQGTRVIAAVPLDRYVSNGVESSR
jgi:ligand-binding sensor domain-containing protein/signal transduction histidine kinase